MKIGIDITRIKRVSGLLANPEAAQKVFNDFEISDNVQKMAGILAAKEAYFKARGQKGDWRALEVRNTENGQPVITDGSARNISLSISHDGEYAVAVVIYEDI